MRGLKFIRRKTNQSAVTVAPHTGAWIEIVKCVSTFKNIPVAPHTGAWIEIFGQRHLVLDILSHPTRVRGLKLSSAEGAKATLCRTPHGCVD